MSMLARPIRSDSYVDQVADGIAAQIEAGEYPVGQMLPSVRVLSEAWQVSRTVLREALARLSATGMVVSRQGLGFFVAARQPARRLELSPAATGDHLARIIELRMAVETEAAALAATRRTAAQLAKLRQAVRAMEATGADDDLRLGIEADLAFHETIYAATCNPHFLTLFAVLSGVMRENISASRRNSASMGNRRDESQVEHKAILAAIAARDPDAAREAARTHVTNTAGRLGLGGKLGGMTVERRPR